MKFSIGYNHDIRLLGLLDIYKDNVESFYFPIPRQYLGSGRQIVQKNSYANEIPGIIKKCDSLGIRSQLLLNATCEGEAWQEKEAFREILCYIVKLKDLGLKSLVVTNPVYIPKIKEQIKGIEVESSVNCYVKTVEQAVYFKDLGVDVLTIDRDINRDIPLIRKIKNKTGLKIKIMLNEGCLRNCPFRSIHYNYLSHNFLNPDKPLNSIFADNPCTKIYLKNPEKIFSIPFIPPEALPYYAQVADYYKLTTRVFPTWRVESCLKAYIDQNFNGNLIELLDCPGLTHLDYINYGVLKNNDFFKKMIKCDNNCKKCNYCDKLMKEAAIIKPDFLSENDKERELKKAIKMFKGILRISRINIPVYLKLSAAYFNLKQYEKAIEIVNKVIKLNPKEASAYALLSSYHEKMGNYNEALKVYKNALKIFPNTGVVYLGLGRAYFHLKKYEAAISKIKRAIELDCKDASAQLLLNSCYERIG